jgi:hypothetical protein
MKKEKWVNILVNSMSSWMTRSVRRIAKADNIDHGVSLPKPDINACEQTAEGLSKQMFDNEEFDVWSVTLGSSKE